MRDAREISIRLVPTDRMPIMVKKKSRPRDRLEASHFLRLPTSMLEALQQWAARQKARPSVSAAIRAAIEKFLREEGIKLPANDSE